MSVCQNRIDDVQTRQEELNQKVCDLHKKQSGKLRSLGTLSWTNWVVKVFQQLPRLYCHFENLRSQLKDVYSETYELTYVMTALKADAHKRFSTHEQSINNFEDFERLFLKHFWGRLQQQKVLTIFWNGRYEASFHFTREKYATNKYFVLQNHEQH